ncbi:hypothetical protein SLEP1_g27790 [Rubroshorea leprosula]|uniref:Uncharacterized protein n=1 Tax=Rubroshorea leprosula TaxID=152421 RepID=A0AAV5JRH6_9ROSI|nr:hypothetical protein SLEP1_g27790 [Rubroshorea leprosula]
MGVAVLNPEDCLKHHFSKQTLISPTKWNHPKNPTSNRTNKSPPNWRKRSPNTSPPLRAIVDSTELNYATSIAGFTIASIV